VGEIGEDTRSLADDMLETMYDAQGRGLAAPQVGVLTRLFVMDATWKDGVRAPSVCIDPKILETSDETTGMEEGCLSIPGITTEVMRPAALRLAWTTLEGERVIARLDGAQARIALHEIDHLDGVVTLDRLSPEARAEAEAQYASA
jgi:peptide deformylase